MSSCDADFLIPSVYVIDNKDIKNHVIEVASTSNLLFSLFGENESLVNKFMVKFTFICPVANFCVIF
jgi:hypothetical protein